MAALGYEGGRESQAAGLFDRDLSQAAQPLSGIILSQSGCGRSTLTEIIEQLTPSEDVLLFTRIADQALIYIPEGLLKGKLLIVEERVGAEAGEYSIRILESRLRFNPGRPAQRSVVRQNFHPHSDRRDPWPT